MEVQKARFILADKPGNMGEESRVDEYAVDIDNGGSYHIN